MKTEETNKLIAEFMGYEWLEINKPYIAVKQPNGGTKHFQTDWNDLMEVVEKIESLGYNLQKNNNSYTIVGNRINIKPYYNKNFYYKTSFNKTTETTKIEAVYNTCVTFIEWYNEQKQA